MNRHTRDSKAHRRGRPNLARWQLMSALLVVAGLVACGGGGGEDEGGASPPGGQRLAVGADSLAGDWLSRVCTPAGTRSLKLRLRVVPLNDNAISYSQTFVRYTSADCSGTGAADARSTPLGTVTFSRSDASARAAANWGLWVLPNGVQSGAIWGKKGVDTTLCIGATDRAFGGLDSLNAVSSWMDLSDASCYNKS